MFLFLGNSIFGCAALLEIDTKENMVFIPEGSFTMGFKIDNYLEWGDMDEEPVHPVTLSAYWIDKYEVTSSGFANFLNANNNQPQRLMKKGLQSNKFMKQRDKIKCSFLGEDYPNYFDINDVEKWESMKLYNNDDCIIIHPKNKYHNYVKTILEGAPDGFFFELEKI